MHPLQDIKNWIVTATRRPMTIELPSSIYLDIHKTLSEQTANDPRLQGRTLRFDFCLNADGILESTAKIL
jgi:hypothetical protein